MSAARSRLEHAISEGQLLSSLDNASSIRDLLGQQDLQAKTFLKNLTRFHRLKQRLDAVAGDILSAAFLNDARYASRPADLLQPPGDLDAQLARGKEALEPLSNVVARAVEAAGLRPDSQPNQFIELSRSGPELYTSATLGPLKKRERVEEKVANEYGGDVRRCVDVARASVVVDTEDELKACFDQLFSTGAVVRLKNRFAKPSFNGYRDALFNLRLDLPSGAAHVVEVQVHLSPILESKAEAHEYYDYFRRHFHGNLTACDDCMRLLDGVVAGAGHTFSVRLLERVAASSDVGKLEALGELFEHRCSQFGLALIFRKRLVAVEFAASTTGQPLAAALRELSSLLRKTGKYDDAAHFAELSLELSREALERPVAVLGPEVAAGLCDLGRTFLQKGEYDKARAALDESLAIYDRAFDADAVLRMSPVLRGAALCHADAARAAPLRGAVPCHASKGWTLLALSELAKDRAEFPRAVDYADRAAEIWEGLDETLVAHALMAKGPILQHMGRIKESKAAYERAYDIRRRSVGAHHPDAARCLRKIGTTRRYDGDLAGADESYAAAVAIFEKAHGDDHVDTIKCLSDRAELLLARGSLDAAEALVRRARDAAVRLFGSDLDHLLVRETQALQGMLASARGDTEAALRLLGPAADAEARLNMPGRHKSTLLMVQARERKDSGANAAEVAALAREALAIRRRIFRPPDETAVAADLVAGEGERPPSAPPKSGVVILT